MDEMIKAVTGGIGAELGRPIWREYFQAKESIVRNETWKSAAKEKQLLVIDMLALCIFQRHVLVPLHGASNFLEGVEKLGVNSVSMGAYVLGSEYRKQSGQAVRTFYAITKTYNIDISDLNISDIDNFVRAFVKN